VPNALAISPHLDDAAFSAGGTIAMLAARGWLVTVATVFTASVPDPQGFALACQLDKGLSPDVDYMALRREEDRAACERLGAVPRWLGWQEAPHRGYGSAAALFGPLRPGDRIDHADTLESIMREAGPDLVLAPQGLGGHVDHVQLVRRLLSMGLAPSVLWWRDFPYSARKQVAEPFGREMGELAGFTARLDAAALERKQAACLAYRSQIGFQFGGPEGLRRLLQTQGASEEFRVRGVAPW
jgi:LmbE family N-acetylglucosaminyl deacetylase